MLTPDLTSRFHTLNTLCYYSPCIPYSPFNNTVLLFYTYSVNTAYYTFYGSQSLGVLSPYRFAGIIRKTCREHIRNSTKEVKGLQIIIFLYLLIFNWHTIGRLIYKLKHNTLFLQAQLIFCKMQNKMYGSHSNFSYLYLILALLSPSQLFGLLIIKQLIHSLSFTLKKFCTLH